MAKKPTGSGKSQSPKPPKRSGLRNTASITWGRPNPPLKDPFDTPEKAYAEAERLIAEALRSRAMELNLPLRFLDRLPTSITKLSKLRKLSLVSTMVTDLALLADLTALETLQLDGTQVAELSPVAGLNALAILRLDGTKVDDLAPLAGLTAIRFLDIDNTQVGDIAPVANLTRLQHLWLNDTSVADIVPLAKLTGLETLGLNRTTVTDLTPLARLNKLKTLWLDGTKVADIAPLANLTALEALRLNGTKIADLGPVAGLINLSKAAQHRAAEDTFAGLYATATPASEMKPFRRLLALPQPHATVETINELRRRQGLPPHIPEGYPPAAGLEPTPDLTPAASPDADTLVARGEVSWPFRRPKPPPVPEPRPAAVEPVVEGGKITLPKTPLASDLAGDDLTAALQALKKQIERIANSLREEGNVDKRVVHYLDDLATRIPVAAPPQHVLFEIAHELTTLQRYARTVNTEWPDILAAGYHSMVLSFDRTVRQFPRWREFWRNASRDQLTAEQQQAAPEAIKAAVAEIRAAPIIDEEIPARIETLAMLGPPGDDGSTPEPDAENDPVAAGKEALIEDALESLSNTLKKMAGVALDAWKFLEPERKTLSDGLKKARKSFNRKLGEGLASLGDGAYKWLVRIAKTIKWGGIGGGIVAGATSVYGQLITKFPNVFGWLAEVLKFFS